MSDRSGRLLGVITALVMLGSGVAIAAPVVSRTTGSALSVRPPAAYADLVAFAPVQPTVRVWEDATVPIPDPTLPDPARRPAPPTTTTTAPVSLEAPQVTGITLPIQFFDAPRQSVVHNRRAANDEDCRTAARAISSSDRNGIARMIQTTFKCVLAAAGVDGDPATATRGWNGSAIWGFESKADQYAAEAVVVSYCESAGFDRAAISADNPWGYGGLFQMGGTEMRRWGLPGSSKYDPVDNTVAAARYLLHVRAVGGGWDGWSPWAVVNTNFSDEVNDKVKVPVLPRFTSTDPEFRGVRGAELPEWAVDPWSWAVPAWNGCPYAGSIRWPAAVPLA